MYTVGRLLFLQKASSWIFYKVLNAPLGFICTLPCDISIIKVDTNKKDKLFSLSLPSMFSPIKSYNIFLDFVPNMLYER